MGELLRDLVDAVLANPTPPLAPWELYGLSQQDFNTCTSTPAGGGTRYDYCDAANLYGTPNAFPYNPAATAPATQPTVSAPRAPLSLGRFADDTFFDVIQTRVGDVEVLAEVSVNGRALTLSDVAIYGADGPLVNQVQASTFIGVRNALATEAAEAGFDTLRIQGIRGSGSSSANPGAVIDRVIDLERFR